MVGLPNPSIAASGSAFFANALTEALVQLIEGALGISSKNMAGGCEKRCVFSERQVQTESDAG